MPAESTVRHQPVENQRRIGRVILTTIVVPGGFRVPPHGHASASVCVVDAGAFDEETRRGSEACVAGTLRYSPAADHHRLQLRDVDMQCTVITLNRDEVPESTCRLYRYSPPLADLAARLRNEVDSGGRGCPLVAETMALELFARLVRHEKRRRYAHPPRWLVEVRRSLDDPASWSLTLDELAASCGHNGAHLACAFREHFGLTIGDYVRARQLSVARTALLQSRAPISQVAALAGFADQSHLTRMMQRSLGTTPGRLRATATASPG